MSFTLPPDNCMNLLEFSQKAAMASRTPKPRSSSRQQPLTSSGRSSQRTPPAGGNPPEVVDPVWLIKAVGVTLIAALICGYVTLCLLFYQGQWQLVLHPSRSKPAPATIAGAPFQTVHFGVDESATPQLTGWLIPAEPSARYGAYTVLYLPSGDGSLADSIATLAAMHEIGINIFAFDYRGYGQSAPTRPNQERMTADAASGWQYLTVSRALQGSHIVLFGDGVGAALAAQLAASHPEAPALVVQSPRPEVIKDVLADPRTKSLPVRLLFHENFEISTPVSSLQTPKLFLISADVQSPGATTGEVEHLTSTAATPKIVASLRSGDFNGPIYREQIVRFLDQYLR